MNYVVPSTAKWHFKLVYLDGIIVFLRKPEGQDGRYTPFFYFFKTQES